MTESLKIAVLDDYLSSAQNLAAWSQLPGSVSVQFFTKPIPAHERSSVLADFDVLVLTRERMPLDRNLILQLPRLKLVVTTGLRNASIDVAACAERGIPVTGTRSLTGITAETTWLLILALTKKFEQNRIDPAQPTWQQALPDSLEGRTLGVVGLGKIGRRVAAIGKAFGMRVIAWSQNLLAEHAEEVGVEKVSKETLFRESDVVTLHLVLSDRTRHIVGQTELDWMRKGSYLVNTSRAGLVDEQALIATLKAEAIGGAGLDVFNDEPLPATADILGAPHTVLTPHIGYVSSDNYKLYYTDALENIIAWMDGKVLRELVPARVEGPASSATSGASQPLS